MQQLDAFKAPNAKSKAFLSTALSPQARGSFFFFLDAGEIFPKRHNIRSLSTFLKRSNIIRFLPRSGLKERKHLNKASQDSQDCFSSFFSATVHALSREHRVCLSSAQCEPSVRSGSAAPLSHSGSHIQKHRNTHRELQSWGVPLLLRCASVLAVENLP